MGVKESENGCDSEIVCDSESGGDLTEKHQERYLSHYFLHMYSLHLDPWEVGVQSMGCLDF